MAKYRKLPVIVEAEQFWPKEFPWPDGVYRIPAGIYNARSPNIVIDTPEGRMNVSAGDWIITGIKGEKYPCKPDIFEMTYEAVE